MHSQDVFHHALFRMNVWFDRERGVFAANSPDLDGWHAEATHPYALHQLLREELQLPAAWLDLQFNTF